MKTWLLLDCHFLAYRAFYSTGDLSYEGVKTGVTYGFLRDVQELMHRFDTNDVVFCFDVGYNKRKNILPTYKEGRHREREEESTREEKEARKQFLKEVRMLRKQYLHQIGYRNILWQKGHESDDIIASLCETISNEDQIIIVSADKDFRQLVRHNVMLYNPVSHKRTTLQSFRKDTGLKHPKEWAKVLAIAGCHTDNVKGVKGVGEITAIKYLTGQVWVNSPKWNLIHNNLDLIDKNTTVVKLPLKGTKTFELQKDEVTAKSRREVFKILGIKTI